MAIDGEFSIPGGAIGCRRINSAEDEGPLFRLILHAVADFYVGTMKAQVRHDAPGVLVKWSRDWGYPWVLTRASVRRGDRVLDCGSGFSPVPFLLSRLGARVWAVDRDVPICSRSRYAMRCLLRWVVETAGLVRQVPERGRIPPTESSGREIPSRGQAKGRARRRGFLAGTARFAAYHLVEKHRKHFGRIWHPDFWGPVSPRLLSQFGVRYVRGDLTHLPFPNAHFDLVTCVSVLEHMPAEAQRQSVQEMARVLRPGGTLLLTYDREHDDPVPALAVASGLQLLELTYLDAPTGGDRPLSNVAGARLVSAQAKGPAV